ncbi:MAG TPA: AAA family ATPase, partial [Kofleriaceae bacterium]|nr:AAA family ATPase [Kofleriaceae bacterium]
MRKARETLAPFEGTERFQVLGRAGGGAMGLVFRAYDREHDSVVALKLLRRGDPAALLRFKNEFRALADVSHPNLVTLYELLSEGEHWFFTMELIDGVDFLAHVRGEQGEVIHPPLMPSRPGVSTFVMPGQGGTLDTVTMAGISEPTDIDVPAIEPPVHIAPPLTHADGFTRLRGGLLQLAAGLNALHAADRLHRDIKPSNVLVAGGRVVILDFGVVTGLAQAEEDEAKVVGTPAYMAPELAAGERSGRSGDWYSVGVMLYEALAGRRPFIGSARDLMAAKQQRDPRPILEVNPEAPADLAQLCTDLLARDPARRPTGVEVMRRLGARPGEGPAVASRVASEHELVGRDAHLAILRGVHAAVLGGEPRTVFAHGPTGVGKSALVSRFLAELRATDTAVVLAGRCYERESVPYKAFDGLIDELSRHLLDLPRREVWELVPPNAQALARVFPVLRRVEAVLGPPGALPDKLDPHELRRRAFAALRELLAKMARRRPLILWIDDLQWGDLDSAALLEYIMRPPDAPPLLLVASYRREAAAGSPLFTGLTAALPTAVSLPVDPLSLEDSRTLAAGLLGDRGAVGVSLVESIARESRGNPFFVYELIRFINQASGDAPKSLGGSVSLEQVLEDRRDALPVAARQLLDVIAVAGRPVTQAVALRAADMGGGDEQATVVLRNANLVRTRGVRDQDAIECFHDRIREVVVAKLPADVLRACHARLAAALEESGEADAETLSIHFEGASDRERAHGYAVAAADAAAAALAFDRATELYRRAFRLRTPSGDSAASLYGRLGDALANAGRQPEAAAAYLDAAHSAGDADALEYRRRAAESYLRSGHVDDGVRTLQTVLSGVGLHYPSPRRALLLLALRRAWIRLRGTRFRERDPGRVTALEMRRVDACWTASLAFGMCDSIRGADFQARHLLLALKAGQRFQITRALTTECAYASLAGKRGEKRAKRLLARADELHQQLGHPYTHAWTHAAHGLNHFMMGRYRQAFERSREAEGIFAIEAGHSFERVSVQLYQLWALYYLGEIGDVARRVPVLLRDARDRGDLYAAASLSTGLPNAAWLARDDVDGARLVMAEAMKQWSRQNYYLQHYWSFISQQNTELYAGEGLTSWRIATEGWRALARSLLLHISAVKVEAIDAHARCALAAAVTGRDALGLARIAERGARRLARLGLQQAPGLAALLRAGAAAVRGQPDECAAHLEDAATKLDAADMAMHAAAARRRLGILVAGDRGAELVRSADD